MLLYAVKVHIYFNWGICLGTSPIRHVPQLGESVLWGICRVIDDDDEDDDDDNDDECDDIIPTAKKADRCCPEVWQN